MVKKLDTVKEVQLTKRWVDLHVLNSPRTKEIKKVIKKSIQTGINTLFLQPGNIDVANKLKPSPSSRLTLGTVLGLPPIPAFNIYKKKHDARLHILLGPHKKEHIQDIKRSIENSNLGSISLVFPMYWYARGELVRISKLFKYLKKNFKGDISIVAELGTIFRNKVSAYEIAALINDAGLDTLETNTGVIDLEFNELLAGVQRLQIIMNDMSCSNFKPLKIKATKHSLSSDEITKLFQAGVSRVGVSNITEIGETKNDETN